MKRETKLDITEMGRGYLGAFLLMTLMWTGVVSAMYAGESMPFATNITNPISNRIGGSKKYIKENVTVYVPEYIDKIINNTKEVEVEKIVDKIEYVERGYELWHILLGILVGMIFGWLVLGYKKKEVEEVPEF